MLAPTHMQAFRSLSIRFLCPGVYGLYNISTFESYPPLGLALSLLQQKLLIGKGMTLLLKAD